MIAPRRALPATSVRPWLMASMTPMVVWVAGALLMGALSACGDDGPQESQCVGVGDGPECAGVAETTLGTETWYTEDTQGVSCTSTLYVRSGATGGTGTLQQPFGDLPEAASAAVTAGAGSCIALARGTYSGATLPEGVSLLGRGSAKSHIVGPQGGVDGAAALTVSGEGVLVRGVAIEGEGAGLVVQDATDVRVASVLVDRVRRAGLWIERSATVTVEQVRVVGVRPDSDLPGAVGVGVYVLQGTAIHLLRTLLEECQGSGLIHYGEELRIEQSIIRRNASYGIAATCYGSPCASSPAITVQGSVLEDNRGVSVWLSQAVGVLENVTVRGTARDGFGYSRSLEGADLPDLQVVSSLFESGEDLGILLHNSNASIQQTTVVGQGGRGIWVQDTDGAGEYVVDITGTDVIGSTQVGIGILGGCNVTVSDSQVLDTVLGNQVTDTGTIWQGDGVQALPGSTVTVDTVLFQGNARQSIVADDVAFLTVTNNEFLDEVEDPVAVQNIGVDDISSATNVEYTNNQGAGGSPVDPMIPPDPYGVDTSEIARSVPSLM